jgi:hypothetical protein
MYLKLLHNVNDLNSIIKYYELCRRICNVALLVGFYVVQ